MAKKNEVTIENVVETKDYNVEELMTQYKTKSAVIRYLASENVSRSTIATILNIRYQHVRNVLTQVLKKV